MKYKSALVLALFIQSCNYLPDWMGAGEDVILEGERYAVMENAGKVAPDPTLDELAVETPSVQDGSSYAQHAGNFSLNGNLQSEQTVSAGAAAEDGLFLTTQPLVADGRVFVIDGESNIKAFNANTLTEIWSKNTGAPEEDSDLPGGGLTYAYGVLYAATGYGYIVAISAEDGTELWRKNLEMSLRRPPVIIDEKIYATTSDNQLFCLSAVDGSTVWRHSGAKEVTAIYGSSAPAVKNDIAVIAYSSGEVFGVNTTRGNETWTELLGSANDRRSAAASINDVTASPVIVDGIVYIGGHSGELVALNLSNGFRIWQQKLGAIDSTPWAADRWIFTIAQGRMLVALNRLDGRIKWVKNLPKSDDKTEIVYSGPVMAGGNLLVSASNGKLYIIDSKTGDIASTKEIPEGVYSAPVVANGSVYLLTNDANLVLLK